MRSFVDRQAIEILITTIEQEIINTDDIGPVLRGHERKRGIVSILVATGLKYSSAASDVYKRQVVVRLLSVDLSRND